MSELTYAPVGATRTGDRPAGFRHLFYRTPLGSGEDLFRRAGEAVVTFQAWPWLTGAPRAVPGAHVAVGFGPLRVPCEIIWATDTGFAYGTLPGHQAAGEEAFVVERDERDKVWFTVRAYSRPATPLMRLAGPAAVVFQHSYARLCGRALKRLCTVKP